MCIFFLTCSPDSVAVYEITCQETGRKIDSSLVAKMKAENERRLKEVN